MSSSVFISYSRRNRHYAERLQIDLQRAGIDAWLDLSDIPPGDDFEQRILPEIANRSHLVLLVSPETKGTAEIQPSAWVLREVNEALRLGKSVVPLRIAGPSGSHTGDPEETKSWERLNMIENAATDYWTTIRRLTAYLGASVPQLRSISELLESGNSSVREAVQELRGTTETIGGREFAKIPIAPSGYGMTWMYAPLDAPFHQPEALGVLFNHTNSYPGTRFREAIEHWTSELNDWSKKVSNAKTYSPWLVMLEGPVTRDDEGCKYELRAEQMHEWLDCIRAGASIMEDFVKRRRWVGYYFNSLVQLAFEVALRTTMAPESRRVYHYHSRQRSQGKYVTILDGWKAP